LLLFCKKEVLPLLLTQQGQGGGQDMNRMLGAAGHRLAAYLAQPGHAHAASPPTPLASLRRALRPGDVILVEGTSRISVAIKYLTQSTWSHAALFVGPAFAEQEGQADSPVAVEADIVEGVRAVGLGAFAGYHCRICRPVDLTAADLATLIAYVRDRVGAHYDLRNLYDLARYLLPTPPVPSRLRRRMITLGSGDPTRAICSTLLAHAFQAINYPILPDPAYVEHDGAASADTRAQLLHIRRSNTIVPRDFDVSPYFQIVKPALVNGFSHRALRLIDS
jgi:Permuted papain-like amidase enzyme, YaeF/YiiX, C92 family